MRQNRCPDAIREPGRQDASTGAHLAMSTAHELIARIEAAMERIRAATNPDTKVDFEDKKVPLFRKVRRLGRANRFLTEQVAELKQQRDRDIAELDALVDELKPLIGDA